MPESRFSVGRVVATPRALKALAEAGQTVAHFLALHAAGCWSAGHKQNGSHGHDGVS